MERGGAKKQIDVPGVPIRWLNSGEILVYGAFGTDRLQRVDVDTGTVMGIVR